MEFFRQEYWRKLPFSSPGDLPDPGIEQESPTLWADSSPSEPPGQPLNVKGTRILLYSIWVRAGRNWASLVAQLVKNLPARWETWVQSLGWEDPLEKGKATHSSIMAWRIPWTSPWGHKASDATKRLSLSLRKKLILTRYENIKTVQFLFIYSIRDVQ